MVKFIINVTQSLIIALIFVTIIEMLLPNGSNKKYVKMVGGIYIIFTILNPVLELFNKNIDFNFFDKLETVQTNASINEKELKDYYINSFKLSIKNSLENQGYKISNLNITLNEDNSEIIKAQIKCANINDFEEIKKFLSQNYGINADNIILN